MQMDGMNTKSHIPFLHIIHVSPDQQQKRIDWVKKNTLFEFFIITNNGRLMNLTFCNELGQGPCHSAVEHPLFKLRLVHAGVFYNLELVWVGA
jgi:hypothetical protein